MRRIFLPLKAFLVCALAAICGTHRMVVIEDPLFVSLRVGGVTLATMHVREIDLFQLGGERDF